MLPDLAAALGRGSHSVVNMSAEEEVVAQSAGIKQILGYWTWIVPVLLLGTTVVLYSSGFGRKKLKLPPYLRGYPLVGTMFTTRGPQAHNTILSIGKKLGPIFALKTGLRFFVVVTDADIAHDALIKNGQVFATRVKPLSRQNFTGSRSVNSAQYGSYWREIRRNMVAQVLTTSRVEAFRPYRDQELDNLTDRVRTQAKANDNVVPVLSNCRHTIFAILLHVAFGEGFDDSKIAALDVTLRRLMQLLATQLIDFLPFLQTWFGYSKHKDECQALLQHMREVFTPLIEEHAKLRESGKPVEDYLDSLLVLKKELDLSETDVLGLLGEILTGGTDTTANTLEWAMGRLIHHPEMQARVYEEIRSVVPDGRKLDEDDVEKLPYLHAVLKETMRRHTPLPFGLIHGVTEPTKLAGFDVTEDNMVLFGLTAFHKDPKRWDQPEVFNPDRFLSATPRPEYDMTGSHGPRSMDFIPFGAGRRICPAMNLALKHSYLILGRLIQTFEWTTPKPGEQVDFSEHVAFTVLMQNRLYARVRERSAL